MSTKHEFEPPPTRRPAARDMELSELALALHAERTVARTVQLIAEYARTGLGCEDAGVLLVFSRSRVETSACTSDPVAVAHDLQVELDEGPCLDALEDPSGLYRIDDLEVETRWPRWSPKVVELGYRSVLSVPLATQERRYGSMNAYASRPHAFDDDDMAVATVLARHASVALASSQNAEGLERAVDARKLIGMAMGMLMERYGLDQDRAFDVLRRYSQDHNIKLRDVAEQIVVDRDLPAFGPRST